MGAEAYYTLMVLGGGAAFLLVFSLWVIVMLIVYMRRSIQTQRLEERLGLTEMEGYDNRRVLRLWREGEYVTTVVPHQTLSGRIRLRAEQLREALGWNVPLGTVGLALAAFGAVGFILGFVLLGGVLPGIATGGAAVGVPFMFVKRHLNKQARLFENQLTDALALAARSLRAGHPLEGAFRLISEEMNPPVSTVFGEIIQQEALGLGMEEAIRRTAAKNTSEDLKLFASSIIIQLRGGGNLAEMLERLAEVIRGRIRLHRRAKVLTAQQQLSKRVLVAIPFFLFALLYIINPEYIEPLYTTFVGNMMLLAGAVMLLLGIWVMNRIAVLRY